MMAPQPIQVKSSFNPVDLMPKFGDADRTCPTCAYVATQKANLITHYKLMHLGFSKEFIIIMKQEVSRIKPGYLIGTRLKLKSPPI